jgi:hypothetical protein
VDENNNQATPAALALAAQETALDAFSCTVRGQRYDHVLDALLEAMPPGSRYVRRSKDLKDPTVLDRPKQARIVVPDDNPVLVTFNAYRNDLYLSVLGPLGQRLQAGAQGMNAAMLPHPATGWSQAVRATRIDARLDLCYPGAWDEVTAATAILHHRIPANRRPRFTPYGAEEHGRTHYYGQLQNRTVLVRIYEKGKQLLGKGIDADPNHIRIEVECHPTDTPAFDACYWTPIQVMTTSPLASMLLIHLGHQLPQFTASRDGGTRSSTVRKLTALHRQYGPLFWELARRYDSTEAACRTISAVLLQANPQPARLQTMLDRGMSAPELQADFFGFGGG